MMLDALRNYTLPLLLAAGLHVLAALALYSGWNPEKETLNVVEPRTVLANLIVLQPQAKPAPPPPRQNNAPREAERREAERREAERKAAERKAAEQKEADRQAQLQKEAQERERQEAERLERERLAAEQERLDRLSELAASSMEDAIAQESQDLNSGTEEQVVRSYHAAIYDLVRRNWSRPPSARTGMSARLQVELIPTGEVVAVTIVESSGSSAFDRSAEIAVRQAKRFEVPKENALFERHFRRFYILFQPEDLLR